MVFKPLRSPDRWHGVEVVLGLILLDVLFVRVISRSPINGWSFVLGLLVLASLPILGYLGYRTLGAFTMEYWVDRDGVTLVWGSTRQVVPMADIQCVRRGARLLGEQPPKPWHHPYPYYRHFLTEDMGPVRAYATVPVEQQLILVTGSGNLGLSPADPQGFLSALQSRYGLGIARHRQAEVQRPPLWTWSLWRDRRALILIALGLVGVLLMFGALCFRFPALSTDLPLHFDASGMPDRISAKTGLFALPLIGLLAWGANLAGGAWVYRHIQRQGAYLLWAGAVVVQIIAGVALINLMRW